MGAPDDLHQLHDGGGVKEVHADDLLGALGDGADLGDGDGGGVGGQDGLGLADAVQVGEDALLDGGVLSGGLDDQVGVGGLVQVGGEGDVGQDVGLLGLVHLALGHQLVQALHQAGPGGLDEFILDVTDDHVKALLGKDLGDVQPHGAAADDNDFLHSATTPF